MHRIEVHHFASPFAICGGRGNSGTGDPVEMVGLPTQKKGFSGTRKGPITLREEGGESDTKWQPRFGACLIRPDTMSLRF